MPKYTAETYDATALQKYLHEQGHEHLRVRKHGDLLIIESGRNDDPVKHARVTERGRAWGATAWVSFTA